MISTQLDKWEALKTTAKQASDAACEASVAVDRFAEEHRRNNPLSPSACNALRDRVRSGEGLCCKAGEEFLTTVVDAIWAERINEWAYESLGCRGERDVEEDLRRLNRFLLRRGA